MLEAECWNLLYSTIHYNLGVGGWMFESDLEGWMLKSKYWRLDVKVEVLEAGC